MHIIHKALKAPPIKGMPCTKLLEILIHTDAHIIHKITVKDYLKIKFLSFNIYLSSWNGQELKH